MSDANLGLLCNVCGKIFKSRDALDFHIMYTKLSGHDVLQQVMYIVNVCNRFALLLMASKYLSGSTYFLMRKYLDMDQRCLNPVQKWPKISVIICVCNLSVWHCLLHQLAFATFKTCFLLIYTINSKLEIAEPVIESDIRVVTP